MFNTPILFLIFNRPVETQQVFNEIKEMKPKQLFVASDGARKNNYNDIVNNKLCKDILQQIDWECEVKTLFRDENLGCGKAVSQAISWFFTEVEQGIILEDDCIPNQSFFKFCEELLNIHKHNEKVFHIGGLNFQNGIKRNNESYYYSGVAHIWGWATWRRAWNLYDFELKDYPNFKLKNKIDNYFKTDLLKQYWFNKFDTVHQKKIDTWDYQWTFTIFNNDGITIVPNQNLVTNIGFGVNATHTTDIGKYSNLATNELNFPLIHPSKLNINTQADAYFFYEFDKFQIQQKKQNSIVYNTKLKISNFIERFFINNYFNKKNKQKNNTLLVKADSIGDYLIARNVFNYFVSIPENQNQNFYLLVNSKLKKFINETDNQLYKEIIFFETSELNRLTSLMKFYFKLKKYNFNTVINTVYSRNYQIDLIVGKIGATNKIAHLGDCTNQTIQQKENTDKLYTQLIDISAKEKTASNKHEFYKNIYFFENILNKKIDIQYPSYEGINSVLRDENKIVIFPGAQSNLRTWSAEKYAQLIDKLSLINSNFQFYICTASFEKHYFEDIKKHTLINLVHKIDLNIDELIVFLNDANCIIGSDSGPAHIVASIKKTYVCLSNANHINRFIPYPKNMELPIYVVYPNCLQTLLVNDEKAVDFFNKESQVDIKTISVNEVYNKVIELL